VVNDVSGLSRMSLKPTNEGLNRHWSMTWQALFAELCALDPNAGGILLQHPLLNVCS